jgi:hypothetical protein
MPANDPWGTCGPIQNRKMLSIWVQRPPTPHGRNYILKSSEGRTWQMPQPKISYHCEDYKCTIPEVALPAIHI